MIVGYHNSFFKYNAFYWNSEKLIQKKSILIQIKIRTERISLMTLVFCLNSSTETHLRGTIRNEEMATSVVYSEYEVTTYTATKQDITPTPAQAVATFTISYKRPTIIVYPTVSPESIVIPIISCILGFPLLALLVICCLRRRAKLARERDRRRNYDMQDHAVSLVRFSPIHRHHNRSPRAISLRPERSLSRGFPSLELDTVLEERSDVEQTQTEIFNSDSPLESTSQHNSCSS